MLRTCVCLAALLFAAGTLRPVSAQTAAPAPKMSRVKLTVEHLKEMRANWLKNKPKLAACRKEVRAKGLVGDDR